MAKDFDKTEFGLKAIACERVAGYLFISFADAPLDLLGSVR
jgi:phenylpropionate dioxygenase-like ring-hydroxylating dioxygenase large terminal subunit